MIMYNNQIYHLFCFSSHPRADARAAEPQPYNDCISGLATRLGLERAAIEPLDGLALWNVRPGGKDDYTDPMGRPATLKATFTASRRVGLDRAGCTKSIITGWNRVLRGWCFHTCFPQVGLVSAGCSLRTVDPRELKIISRTERIGDQP